MIRDTVTFFPFVTWVTRVYHGTMCQFMSNKVSYDGFTETREIWIDGGKVRSDLVICPHIRIHHYVMVCMNVPSAGQPSRCVTKCKKTVNETKRMLPHPVYACDFHSAVCFRNLLWLSHLNTNSWEKRTQKQYFSLNWLLLIITTISLTHTNWTEKQKM